MYRKKKGIQKRKTSRQVALHTNDIARLLNYNIDYCRHLISKRQIPFSENKEQNLFVLIEYMLKRDNPELLELLWNHGFEYSGLTKPTNE